MTNVKNAGSLTDARLGIFFSGSVCAYGFLQKDERGTDCEGFPRDLSCREMRTSVVQSLEYIPSSDVTNITTMNSVYTAAGNLLYTELGSREFKVEGEDTILEMFKPFNNLYTLTEAGALLVGHPVSSLMVKAPIFQDHPLCDDDETAVSLREHLGTHDLMQVVFLKTPDHMMRIR